MAREDLKDLTLEELRHFLNSIGEKAIHAKRLFRYLYHDLIDTFDNMIDLPLTLKAKLKFGADVTRLELDKRLESLDGTIKYVFVTHDGYKIETVFIPQKGKNCGCISSQVGCFVGCKFCVTGKKFYRNLTTAEIVDQIVWLRKHHRMYSLVFMGMGEPLLNYDNLFKAINILNDRNGFNFSQRKVTVSTSGIVPNIIRLGLETNVNLAVSLNAVDDDFRTSIMPINEKYNIDALIKACREFPTSEKRTIMFEYVLFKGLNDSLRDADALAELVKDIQCSVNLIPFNESDVCLSGKPDEKTVFDFKQRLIEKGLKTFIRESHGEDIGAACGLLGDSNTN